MKEVSEVVKKARAASAPGPNGIPYNVCKKCPKLLHRLWKLIKVVWRKGRIPSCWQAAEGCFVPKEENSKGLGQFRTISLLNVGGKIFFSILARRMTTYMTSNEYVDTSEQKDRPMDIREPNMKEVSEVVKKARAASAPGPNGIPYNVCKKCPKLLHRLWKLMKVVWRKGRIPSHAGKLPRAALSQRRKTQKG
ncbi:uncharacterized protein [Argopecten irradians]|uniref:uncharacterized protein n=1 Tax=Argopecten irradians TaxID=31199 RepID=UPI00371631DA